MPRIAWFAPNTQAIMGYDHKNRTVGESLGAWRLRPCSSTQPPRCWRSGFSESSSTANSSISGSDEHDPAKNLLQVSVREPRSSSLSAAALNFVVDPLQLFRPARLFRGDVFDRQPHAGCRPDPQPGFRHGVHGHLAGDPLPAERHRPAARRPLAEAGDDRLELEGAELCAGRGAGASSQAGDLADGRLDLSRCAGYRCRHLSSGRSLPAKRQGHRGLSVQRRDGAGIAVDRWRGRCRRWSRSWRG